MGSGGGTVIALREERVLEYATTVDDEDLVEFVKNSYEFGDGGSVTRSGVQRWKQKHRHDLDRRLSRLFAEQRSIA